MIRIHVHECIIAFSLPTKDYFVDQKQYCQIVGQHASRSCLPATFLILFCVDVASGAVMTVKKTVNQTKTFECVPLFLYAFFLLIDNEEKQNPQPSEYLMVNKS